MQQAVFEHGMRLAASSDEKRFLHVLTGGKSPF